MEKQGKSRKRKLKDYAGVRFGRLRGVRLVQVDVSAENNHKWEFVCDCGESKIASIKNVRSGRTSSCGCLAREVLIARNKTHGRSGSSSSYRTWKDMRARCNNPNDSDWLNYGGRGISVCGEWSDFAAFLADMGERPKGKTLDRIDVNGDYTPENCRWATAETQANNKRTNRVIEFDGQRKTLQQWARKTGILRETIAARLNAGWTVEQALNGGPAAPLPCREKET